MNRVLENIFVICLFFIFGCEKDKIGEEKIVNIPNLHTVEISNLTSNSVTSGGIILSDGGGAITEGGVCWNTTGTPTINDNKTTDNSGSEDFVCQVAGLDSYKTYYLRAYATNSLGTGYGNEIKFLTRSVLTISDYDGNVYNTVEIGNQIWMAENLKSTHFHNGDEIPYKSAIVPDETYIIPVGYNYYDDLVENKDIYGASYSINIIMDSRELCPIGWHVPDISEWRVLIDHLGGENLAGSKMKEKGIEHWIEPNIADNSSGFNALPAGIAFHKGTSAYGITNWYHGIGEIAWFGSNSLYETNNSIVYGISLENDTAYIAERENNKFNYISIRCLKD